MKLTRRGVLGIGGLAAAATLSACGDNSGLGDPSAPASKQGEGAAVTLTQWYHEYGEPGVQEAVRRYASEYPGATVEVKWTPGDYGQILAAQLLTDQVPDVFEVEQGGSLDMIRSGQLADLTDLIAPVRDDFNDAVMKRFTFDGRVHGIPQTIDMQLLYYRPSLLEAAGVAPPSTFEELVTAANAVATPDVGGFFAGNDGGVGVLGTLLLWASGHDQLNEERTEAAFLTDEFYAALAAYREFSQSKGLLQSASADWFSGDAFVNGETAMQWGGLWSLPDILAAHGEDVGVLPFPRIGATGRPAVPFGAFGACVAAKGANVAAAKEFVTWLWIDQTDKQVDFSNSYGTHIPARKSLVARADQLAAGPGADAASLVELHGFANDIMWSGSIGDTYSANISMVVKQDADPNETFADFGALVAAELEKMKK
ncbi:extracellular solute-binding protein [Arachnia propionica]|uniref:Extracellular solute-binding protein n=1 Tax=Arachnia propionica TaxID=1750 RepID=A0A3P1TD50_9ACTN|nr:extracellular solute-binding protein [Arachnia propionica]RRD07314.1 extracellular solute-binding protein [Arachnia propionica]